MNTYLHDNGQTVGPYSDDQIRGMLIAGSITPATLAWQEGNSEWRPVSDFVQHSPPPPPLPPPARKSALAMVSLVYGVVSIFVWLVVFTVAGVAGYHGRPSQEFNVILGLFVIAGMLLNFLAMILGIMAAFRSARKSTSITATLLNGGQLLGVFMLILVGLNSRV